MNRTESRDSSKLSSEQAVVYLKTFMQKRLFRVLDLQTGKTSFVGTKAECKRYLQVLNEKIARQGNRRCFKPSPLIRLYRFTPPVSRKEGA